MKTRTLFLKLNINRQVKLFLSFILFIYFTTVGSAQITDNPKQIKKIPAREVEKQVDIDKKEDLDIIEKEEEPLALSVKKYTDSFDLTNRKSKGFTMIQNNDLLNPGVIYEDRWKKKKPVAEVGLVYEKEQYFGEYKLTSSYVNIVFRDYQEVDGDIIRVFANDDVIISRAYLKGSFQAYKLVLQDGFNKIDFVALNQGESGPNTAQFVIIDENDNVIYNGGWNLATGGIATIMLVKE